MTQGNVFSYRLHGITIGIAEEDGAVTGVFFGRKAFAGFAKAETPVIKKAAAQIAEYLAGKRRQFTVPFVLRGTEFQKAVWQTLRQIPFGETRSYKEIAAAIGRPKAVRAVGMANHRNPVVIVVPCHRVIGHDGSLTGFGGGLPLKRRLLELEGSIALGRQSNQGKNKTDHEKDNNQHKGKRKIKQGN